MVTLPIKRKTGEMIRKLRAHDCSTNARQEMHVAQCKEYTMLISGFQKVKAKFRGCKGVH